MPPVKGAAAFFKPLTKPYGNAFVRKLLADALRLLVGVSLDIAAMRSNGDQSAVAAIVKQPFDEFAVGLRLGVRVGGMRDLRINLATKYICAGQPKAVSQIVVFRFGIPESQKGDIRLLIVQGDYRVKRKIRQLSPVRRVPSYTNLLTYISPYSGDLAMVRRTMLADRSTGNITTWYNPSVVR